MNEGVALDDKYALEAGRAYMTGVQAIVRLALEQSRADRARSKRTAGFVAGYRGSPLGGLDLQLRAARAHLEPAEIEHWEAINEELAATAIQGTQQAQLDGLGTHDGVVAYWYGKGPGVDRAGDALKHGNLMGTSPWGGVLCLLGDDHLCESSTTAHQSEYACVDAQIPVLNPADIEDILRFGRIGVEMSRYSGAWIALKCVHDTVESASAVDLAPIETREPEIDARPAGGLSIRFPDAPLEQERRLHRHKLPAAIAFAAANGVDRIWLDAEAPELAIVTAGKAHLDVVLALEQLGLDEAAAAEAGLRWIKLGLVWPIDPDFVARALLGVPACLVVEEKRGLIEEQIKAALYGQADAPSIEGKRDLTGAPLFPSHGALDPIDIAIAIARRLDGPRAAFAGLAGRIAALERGCPSPGPAPVTRTPYFCPGCPHNRSTQLPEGSVARAGIGCHYLAQFMDRANARHTQMGGEGAAWIGEGRFSRRRHVFQNMGDGTWVHSGSLALRAAVAAKANVTFKILYNDAVAMTGGQGMDGPIDPPRLARQLAAEGVGEIAIVADDPAKYPADAGWPEGARVHSRDALDAIQKRLREKPGVTAILYDQTCAAEKRRRRKRGVEPTPDMRVYINEAVCEGCGDCGKVSNCVAIQPVETPMGRKRRIDQGACNFDYSCLEGFCPSFVTIEGGRAPAAEERRPPAVDDLPEPLAAPLDKPHAIAIVGVGGTGVITTGALLGMAARLDGLEVRSIDQSGLAQKGGPVATHVAIAPAGWRIGAAKIARGGADLLLGADPIAAAASSILALLTPGRSRAVIDGEITAAPGEFTRDPDLGLPAPALLDRLRERCALDAVPANALAARLFADPTAANVVLLGYAAQRGLLPVSVAALRRAIELNGRALRRNLDAFAWGRIAAAAPERLPEPASAGEGPPQASADLVEQMAAHLEAYQDRALAERYREKIEAVIARERALDPNSEQFARAAAFALARFWSPKDEYEVARLYVETGFLDRMAALGGTVRLRLAPAWLVGEGGAKRAFGPWIATPLRWLARAKWARNRWFDPFRHTADRRAEREQAEAFERLLDRLMVEVDRSTLPIAAQICETQSTIRGFGPVRTANAARARATTERLLDELAARGSTARAAA